MSSQVAGFMRTAALAVAVYDYLQTVPFEFRGLVLACRNRRLSQSLVLFLCIRYTSVVALVISNYGFFANDFSLQSCTRYFLFPSIFKVVQAMASQAILGVRAFNLSRKSASVGYILLAIYVVCCTFEWVTTMYSRQMDFHPILVRPIPSPFHSSSTNDLQGNHSPPRGMGRLGLLRCSNGPSSASIMAKITRLMLRDGLAYFVALALINVLNLIFYRVTYLTLYDRQTAFELQTAAASLGYTVTFVMSQKLVIHLHEASINRGDESANTIATVLTQQLTSPRDVSRAMRSQFESKSDGGANLTVPDLESMTADKTEEEVDVQVRVERTVRTEPFGRVYELEDYSRNYSVR
ncbi:hypothetical protein MKEN_00666300 [Mycena kentingensis (nom. inval.)]|nr:hypothetical protein MKEN_00666300 [Mycena kentingensis (nom. inval.)]